MRLLLTIIKLVLSTLALIFIFDGDSLIEQIVIFAVCYGMITYYMYYIKGWIEDGPEEGFMEDGIFMMLLMFVFKLCIPILTLLIPIWILQKIFGEKVGMNIGVGLMLIGFFGCLVYDLVGIVRIFKPDFLDGGTKAQSGYIEDDAEQ